MSLLFTELILLIWPLDALIFEILTSFPPFETLGALSVQELGLSPLSLTYYPISTYYANKGAPVFIYYGTVDLTPLHR